MEKNRKNALPMDKAAFDDFGDYFSLFLPSEALSFR
jgi:hypothetical protein